MDITHRIHEMEQNRKYLNYALDDHGRLVHVDDVPNGKACKCVCPACKGALQAKNKGEHRIHHFAHQSGVDCPTAYETCLHLLAKEKIQRAFYEASEFTISFFYNSCCKNLPQCPYVRYGTCTQESVKTFNLKDFYDTCEQEKKYDYIGRRSDLKISSSTHPERPPIYIEIYVTHASDSEKLHGGNRIIEIKIDSEEDIDNITRNGFIEDPNRDNTYRDATSNKQYIPKVSFWGFKKEDYLLENHDEEIEFSRYILYKSGKYQCRQEGCMCNQLKKISKHSLYEVCFHTPVAFGIHEIAKWMGYRKFGIKNCLLCSNYVDDYYGMGKLCRLYKRLNIPRDTPHDKARAKECPSFILNTDEMNACLHRVDTNDIPPITEFT